MSCRDVVAVIATSVALTDTCAQGLRIQPEVESTLALTSNASYATVAQERADTILDVNPRLVVISRGGRASVEGAFGVEAIVYGNHSQPSIVRPRGELNLRTQLVERLMFFNATVGADRVSADPYAAHPESVSAFNDYTSLRLRLTPYIERQLSPTLSLLARTDHLLTRRVGSSSASDPGGTEPVRDAHTQGQLVQLDNRPTPFGWTAEVSRQDTRYRNLAASVLTETMARGVATYAFDPQLSVGAIIGRELNEYSLVDRTDSILGARMRWHPTERSAFNATLEKRFFGTGIDIEARHRSPLFGFTLRVDRQPVAQAGSHLLGAAGDDIATLLDGVLTTRYPDATQRGVIVGKLIRDMQLPAALIKPLDLYTSYAQLQQNASATVLLFGRLTTVSMTLFGQQRTRLVDVEDILAPASLTSDNRQLGVEIDVARRLSPTVTADAAMRVTRITGLGARAGQWTRDGVIRVGVSRQVSPTTRLSLGGRHQIVASTVTTPARETALVAAVTHRF